MPGFLLAEANIPAQNNPVGRPPFDCGIVPQHFPLDNLAAGRFGGLLVLGRKTHRAHALLDIPQSWEGCSRSPCSRVWVRRGRSDWPAAGPECAISGFPVSLMLARC